MIEIHKLTANDIGRKVVNLQKDEGLITSFNDTYIFVDYQNVGRGQATSPRDLNFIST